MIRVVFFGTPLVSTHSLKALIEDERFSVDAVVTQPPRPVGRKQTVEKSPVHVLADEFNIPVHTPNKAPEIMDELKEIGAHVHVVVAFGQILPKEMVYLPRFGTVNVHPSLLPRWRGAAPVPATILAGDVETGVSVMQMDEKMDHGPILDVGYANVNGKASDELLDELMRMGASLLPGVLHRLTEGTARPKPQDHEDATFCKMLKREDAKIDWTKDLDIIERMIRAYTPWPGTWTEVEFDGTWKRVKILKAHLKLPYTPGNHTKRGMLNTDDETHVGNLMIDELQIEGKNPMSGKEFAATRKNKTFKLR